MHVIATSLPATYDVRLVLLSLAVAALGAYTALDLVGPVAVTEGRSRACWLAGAAVALGFGIWGQHFTGMLAFQLPVPVTYDGAIVAVSLVGMLTAAAAGLFLVRRSPMLTTRSLLGASVLLGVAIVSLHYTGMAAVQTVALPMHDSPLLPLAVIIAIVGTGLALAVVFHPLAQRFPRHLRRAGSTLILAGAIGGMHFTAMAALHFTDAPDVGAPSPTATATNHALLALAVGLAVLTILVLALLGVFFSRRLTVELARLGALREREGHFRAMVDHAADLVAVVTEEGVARYASPSHQYLLGYPPEAVAGTDIVDLIHPDDRARVRAVLEGANPRPDTTPAITFRLRHADGSWRTLDVRVVRRLDDPAVRGIILTARDITARAALEAALEQQALHDTLTGLPNRTLLHDRLAQGLRAQRRDASPLALLLLDLDHFKEVNDTFGHDIGDRLLQQVAIRLRASLRDADTLARLGGDEFAIVLPGVDGNGATRVAAVLLSALDAPIVVMGYALQVGGSIGIALAPTHSTDAGALLRQADVAMYVAKRVRLGFALYDAALDQHDPEFLSRIAALRRAIAENDLRLHYQPKVDLATGHTAWVEALVRWPDAHGDLLPPAQFVPLAERSGLIGLLTQWVLGTALAQVRAWRDAGRTLGVEVNLSTWDLHDPRLPNMIATLLSAHGVSPADLRLEVTETTLMTDEVRALAVLTRIAALGVGIAVDDFGVGHSSLAYLKHLPVDELKIDQSFVREMAHDATDAAIVASTISLGHALGLRVTAEGVADRETWDRLVAMGCDRAQGYYLSRPLPPDDLTRWLDAPLNVTP